MLPHKQAEEAIISNFNETEHEGKEEEKTDQSMFSVKSLLWHGSSVYNAWFSCASNQVKPTKTGIIKMNSISSFAQSCLRKFNLAFHYR
uniref:Uncharacterized protein n=1 Tax=Nelumbo nucifera TaxID=4432 RepID=A0A822YHX8_NELNU|nr:TPA_asm: hypothetical protein HUJ06_011031 [Nelumbo nucifera]